MDISVAKVGNLYRMSSLEKNTRFDSKVNIEFLNASAFPFQVTRSCRQ